MAAPHRAAMGLRTVSVWMLFRDFETSAGGYIARIEKEELVMSIRCNDLGINLSLEPVGLCPTASASVDFCPTASASAPIDDAVNVDLETLRVQMRETLGY